MSELYPSPEERASKRKEYPHGKKHPDPLLYFSKLIQLCNTCQKVILSGPPREEVSQFLTAFPDEYQQRFQKECDNCYEKWRGKLPKKGGNDEKKGGVLIQLINEIVYHSGRLAKINNNSQRTEH